MANEKNKLPLEVQYFQRIKKESNPFMGIAKILAELSQKKDSKSQ